MMEDREQRCSLCKRLLSQGFRERSSQIRRAVMLLSWSAPHSGCCARARSCTLDSERMRPRLKRVPPASPTPHLAWARPPDTPPHTLGPAFSTHTHTQPALREQGAGGCPEEGREAPRAGRGGPVAVALHDSTTLRRNAGGHQTAGWRCVRPALRLCGVVWMCIAARPSGGRARHRRRKVTITTAKLRPALQASSCRCCGACRWQRRPPPQPPNAAAPTRTQAPAQACLGRTTLRRASRPRRPSLRWRPACCGHPCHHSRRRRHRWHRCLP